jgi:hypothetical protein
MIGEDIVTVLLAVIATRTMTRTAIMDPVDITGTQDGLGTPEM